MATTETKAGKKTIFFDDARHRFTDEKGRMVRSVTYYTGIIDKSGVLMNWAVKLFRQYLESKLDNGEQITAIDVAEGSKLHQFKKKEAADIGTRIHELVSTWIKTREDGMLPGDDERVVNGFQAFLKFQAEHAFKWIESEMVVYSKRGYAGILDAVATDGAGKRVLVDFKSSNGIYDEYALQVAAYQAAYEEMSGNKIDYRIIVRFGKEDGEFEFRELHDQRKDLAAFLACKTLKDRLEEMKG